MAVPLIAMGGSGAMTTVAPAAAAPAGMTSLSAAAAALGPVGWAAMGVMAVSTVLSMSAASKQAKYERYQMKLQANQARIDARNTLEDITREVRYSRGSAMAGLGHNAAGIGQSFLAIRSDELSLHSRNVRNLQLGSGATQAGISAASQINRARAGNERMLGYLDLMSLGITGYAEGKRLAGPGKR